MQNSYPFNSVNDDRLYDADDVSRSNSSYFTDGVQVPGGNTLGDQLKITAVSGLTVKANWGTALLKGKNYYLAPPCKRHRISHCCRCRFNPTQN